LFSVDWSSEHTPEHCSHMEHIISVTVENKFGVLSRIAGLFSGRGFNIESLSVAPTLDSSMSQMTIVTSGDDRIIEQIVKQLNKLIDVIKVVDLNESDFVSRETASLKFIRGRRTGRRPCGLQISSALKWWIQPQQPTPSR